MAWYTGITDFFRGAFGEDDDEKKRRKQREAREAAARRNTQRAQQPRQTQQNRSMQDPFSKGGALDDGISKPVIGSKKLFQEQEKVPPIQTPRAPRVTQPKPQPKQDKQDYKGLTVTKSENKTIFGKNAAWLLPKSLEKKKTYEATNVVNRTKDSYLEGFDRLDDDQKKVLVNQLAEQATISNDQASARTLKILSESGRLKGDAWDFIEGYGDKLRGGLARGTLRGVDYLLPGKNTAGLEQLADDLDESKRGLQQYSQSGKRGETAGSINKGIIDAYLLLKGTAGTERVAESAGITQKLAPLLKSDNRILRMFGRALREVPGSAAGTGISAVQTAGRDEEQNLTRDALIGLGADVLLPYGINKLFGGGKYADEATDAIQRINAEKYGDDVERGIAARAKNLENADGAVDDVVKSDVEKQLEDVVNDPKEPAFRRQEAQAELDRIAAEKLAKEAADDPLLKPSFEYNQDIENIIKSQRDELDRYVNERPELTQQQIEAAVEATKQRIIKLTDELKANRAAAYGAVETQAKNADEAAQTLQATTADVAAEQAAKTNPNPASVVEDTPKAGSPEVAANDGYAPRQSTEDIVYGDSPRFDGRDGLSATQRLSPDRIIRENITRPVENAVNRGVNALQTSDNRLARGLGRFFTGFSREAGVDPALQTARMQLRGGIESSKVMNQSINDLASELDAKQLDEVWSTINTRQAERLGKNVSVEDLSPEQLAVRQKLVDIRDNTTVENLKRGFITPEQAADPEYLKQDYKVLYEEGSEMSKFEGGFRQELLGQYKGKKVVSDEMVQEAITDPAYLVGKKQAESQAAWAMQDYGNFLADSGRVSDVPKPGFEQLPDSPLFGKSAGKYVPRNLVEDFTGFQYNMAMVSAFNDVISVYDRWSIRQGKKALLTVFNPAVRLGNQVTNRGIFSQLAGINPVRFNVAMEAAKKEIQSGGQLYREAVQQGLTGVDITQAEVFAQRIAKADVEDAGMVKKALKWVTDSYSGADDQARIAAYMVKRQQGYDPIEAARQVQRGFQDYKSVGFFYDLAAKTPLIGNAFVRFAADSVRIAKNAAIDHPLRSVGTIALWSAFVNGMSVASGESELKGDNVASQAFNLATGKSKSEAQKEREGRFGTAKIPFTDISMAVQTPFGEINVARFMPWYSLNDVPGGSIASKVAPIGELPVGFEDGKLTVKPEAMNDPLLGQFVQVGMDKDFRGKSIRDPEGNGDKFAMDDLSTKDKLLNVGRFLFNNNAPVGREIDQTISAATDNPDMYGKERSIWQALARDFGLKIEQQGDEQAKDRASMETYIADKEEIDRELADMTPAEQEAWRRLTGYYKLRDKVPNEFKDGETRNKKAEVYDFGEDKWRDYASSPRLYKLMVEKKQREAARDGKPIQPEFDERLSESFRKQLIQNKSVAPGDDAELDQRMYSTPEWDYYMQLKDQYKAQAKQYYPDSGKENFDDETVKYDDEKFPDKPPILKEYSVLYKQYLDGQREKPQWSDALTAAKEQYNKTTLDWTNKARAARGLPAITWDVWNNPTFGFDETPSGFGSGYGFGFGGGGGNRGVNTLSELTNFTGSVKRLQPIEAQEIPNSVALFRKLMAGSGGGRTKPKLGASSRGDV